MVSRFTAYDSLQPLISRLDAGFTLSRTERQALEQLPHSVRILRSGQTIVEDGSEASHCCAVLSGFAYRYRILREGARQITSVHMRGEMPNLQSLYLKGAAYTLGALTDCTIAFIPRRALSDLIGAHTGIAAALWRDTLADASITREWITNIGRRPGHERVAHLLCELHARLAWAGLAEEEGYVLPLTQVEIGDATGLTSVHVNRMMGELRKRRLVVTEGKFLHVIDRPGLQTLAGFDPVYLFLQESRPPNSRWERLTQDRPAARLHELPMKARRQPSAC